jgi:hypothetical protein
MCLLMIRNPLEVAASLRKRDNLDKHIALHMWMTYVLEAEYHSRGFRRTVVDYDRLLKDRWAVVDQMTGDLGITWPKPVREVKAALEKEIKADLRRHHASVSDAETSDCLTQKAMEVYTRLSQEPLSGLRAYLDKTKAALCGFELISGEMADIIFRVNNNLVEKTGELMRLGKDHAHAQQVVQERDQQLRELRHERNLMEAELKRIRSHWAFRLGHAAYRMIKRRQST